MVQLTVIKPKPIGRWFIDGLPFNLQTQARVKLVWLFLLFLAPALSKAQPLISSVSPLKGSAGSTVTINGSGFNTVADNNTVYFGSVKAIVKTAAANSLTVTVPKGASLAPVSITTGGLTSWSPQLFIPTFATCASVTDPGVTNANDGVSPFQQIPLLSNSSSAYMLNATDIDGNGFADIISFHKTGVSVFRNSSSGSDLSFAAKYTLTLPAGASSQQTYGGVVADLDGDGKPDIVSVNHTAGRVYVYRNQSTSGNILFSTASIYTGFSAASGIAAGDFDGDGKPDLAIISSDNNTLTFLKNNSTAGAISFTNPSVSIATGSAPASIVTSDLDGDGKIDIAVTNKTGNSVIVYRNNTTTAFSFQPSTHNVGAGPQGLAVGDLNNDGKPDLLVVNGGANTLSILTNNSSAGNINILAATTVSPTGAVVFAGTVAIADFDGDSKPDVLVGSTGTDIYILKNTSTGSAVTFNNTPVLIPTGGTSQPTAVTVGDFNNDGQPDLADANLTGPALDVYRNALGKVQIESLSRTTGVANQTVNVNGSNLSCVTGLTVGGVSTPFTIISPFSLSFTTGTGNTGEVVLLTNGGQYVGPVFTFVTKPANLKYFSGDPDSTIVYGTAAFTGSPGLDDGGGGITYTISGITSNLPDPVVGISINSNTGQIGWSEELPVGIYTITIKAANSAGSTSSQAVIKVVPDAPRDFAYQESSYTSFYGETKQTDAPAINWMGQKIWVAPKTPFRIISPATLPDGVAIDPVTGVISWGPNTPVGTHTLTVRAENGGGYLTTTVDLVINTQPPSGGIYTIASRTIFYGEKGAVAISGINWHGNIGSFNVLAPLPVPAGLVVNTTSGSIGWNVVGTNLLPVGEYNIEVRAKNDAGPAVNTLKFKLIVEAQKPSDIVYTPQPLDAFFGTADNSNSPSVNWHGSEGHFVMEQPADAGITIDPATGRVSWTATVPVNQYILKIKAVNSKGESEVYDFVLNVKPKAPTGLTYSDTEVMYGEPDNKVLPKTLPKWNGQVGTYIVYTVAPAVKGITVNQDGEVLIDPAVPVDVYAVTIRVKNDGGYRNVKFTLTVKAKTPVFSYPSPITKAYGRGDSTIIPVVDWGGDPGVFSNLTVTAQGAYFSFSTLGNGRVIWNDNLPAGTYNVTATASNSGGSTDASFILNVTAQAPSSLTYPSSPATSAFGVADNSGAPSVKWNGGGNRSFEVVGMLPTGFSFDNTTGIISWPATQAIGAYSVTVRARSAAGVSDNAVFEVTVKAGAPSDFYYTNGGDVTMWGDAGESDLPHIDWKGGSGSFAFYDPTGNVPVTITVNPGTGAVSWPDDLPVKQYDFLVRATSTSGDVITTKFRLTVTAGPASGLKYVPDNATVVYGNEGASVKPGIIWYGEEGTFSITEPDPKPAGITVESKTGIIKWSDDVPVKTYNIKVWASNSIGGTTTVFTLNVVAGPPTDLVYSQTAETEQAGIDGNSVTPSVKWHGEKGNFEIVNRTAIPGGITIDNDGVISWDETVLAGTYPVQVKAVNSKGSSNIVTVTIKLTIAKPTISYTPNFKNIKVGEDAVSVEPVINWHGEVGDIGIANESDIPGGITIDGNGVLHFPATLPAGTEVSIYVTVSNAAGQNSTAYKIKVGVPPTDLVYSTVKYSVMRGTLGASVIPTVNWNGLKGQFVATGMPSGVTINASPDGAPTGSGGRLTWNASVATGKYTMVAYAENELGKSNEVTIELEVLDLPTAKISGAGTICAGINKTLKLELTGKAPWSVIYNDGTNPVTISGITASPYNLVVTPVVTTSYTLEKVSDATAENTSLDDADAKVTVTVNTAVTPLINNGNPVSTCNGASLTLTASGAGTGGSYLWSNGNAGASVSVTQSGAYTVTATDNKGCTGTSVPVQVKLNTIPAPVLLLPATTLICEGSSLSLTASGATTYQWYRNNVAVAGETKATYAAKQEGSYTVTGFSEPGCSKAATTSVALTYAKKPEAAFSFDTWCKDVPVNFSNTSVDAAGDAQYTWHFGDGEQSTVKQPVHTFTSAGTVMIILEAKSKSCPDLKTTMPKTVTIETPAEPVRYEPVNALKNRPSILDGRSLGEKYVWAPATGLSNTNTPNPTVTPLAEQEYTFAITTKAGCVTVDTQLVRIFSQAEIFVPRGFTPNNDGVNDRLFPIAVGMNQLHYFKVFNRWGTLMYETQQAGSAGTGGGWDGNYKGKPQPMDSYTWIAEGLDIDGKVIKISGSTVLMR